MTNSSRHYLDKEVAAFAKTLGSGSVVLDAGAGDQCYRPHFEHCHYEAADFEMVNKPYAQSTYVCDLSSIPVDDGRFDAIIFNQVMEHLPEPRKVLAELMRVVKPGGSMLCTAPLFFEEHEKPYDFYRYTQFGWRHLMETTGFEVERLEWMEGYLGTVAYQCNSASRYLPRRPKDIAPGPLGFLMAPVLLATRAIFWGIGQVFSRLDVKAKFTDRGYPKNYVVVVRKPLMA